MEIVIGIRIQWGYIELYNSYNIMNKMIFLGLVIGASEFLEGNQPSLVVIIMVPINNAINVIRRDGTHHRNTMVDMTPLLRRDCKVR